MKNINTKQLGCLGAAAALIGGMFTSPIPTYAIESAYNENYAETITLLANTDTESQLSIEEAYSGAEELVITIRRLEATPDYQKMAKLMRILACQSYDDKQPNNYYGCEKKTTNEEALMAVRAVLPEDKKSQVRDGDDAWMVAYNLIPYFEEFHDIAYSIDGVYQALKEWSMNGLGVTSELNVENIAKIMQKTGDIYYLGGGYLDFYFWNPLELLLANDYTGKTIRLGEKIESMR